MNKCIVGIDDSGRCPVIGSYFLAAVGFKEALVPDSLVGMRDCKVLSKSRLGKWCSRILDVCEFHHVYEMKAPEISNMSTGNLNDKDMHAVLALMLKSSSSGSSENEYIVDNWERDYVSFFERMWKAQETFPESLVATAKARFVVQHKADENYWQCMAAGIVAKWNRDEHMRRLKERMGWDIGTGGNPNEKAVQSFLREHVKHVNDRCDNGCQYIRWNWVTVRRLL